MNMALHQVLPEQEENPFVSFNSAGEGKSRLYDEIWDFTALAQPKREVRFTGVDLTHRHNIQRLTAQYMQHKIAQSSANHFTVHALARFKDKLWGIAKHWGKSDYSLLSHDWEWRDCKASLKGKYGIETLKAFAGIINALHDLGVTSRHTTEREMVVLKHVEKTEQQHVAFPPAMHAHWLTAAVEIVEKYHPYRQEISTCMMEYTRQMLAIYDQHLVESGTTDFTHDEQVKTSARCCRAARKIEAGSSVPGLKCDSDATFVSRLVMASFMVVGLFSGARKTELVSMNPKSYQIKDGIPVLMGLTSKGNEGQPITAVWQTHPIAKQALELAYDATQYARELHKVILSRHRAKGRIDEDRYQRAMVELGAAFIPAALRNTAFDGQLRTSYHLSSIDKSFNAERYFQPATADDVREFDLLNPSRAGELEVGGYSTKFSPHDMRRSFAVFLVRNKLGNLLTIKHQFKHKNLSMSGWYANNAELARMEGIMLDGELTAMFDEAMEDVAVDALDEVYNESSHLSGVEGERIAKSKEEALRRGETILLSRSELRALVRSGDKSIVMLPTGSYCTNPTCERLCSISQFHTESKPCEHEIITDRGARIKAREHRSLVESFREMNAMEDYALSSILEGERQKILYLEQTLTQHNIDFEPFKDEIKAVMA
ncbi:conserved hypothetical protein [Ferrimonas balearica DSM 9799]|uniref:Integrase family protein n=1 Tax=Ferrimonas balearica (strain DSM 9799 / CCM 4581 / KCTC 23876 / PAT) TaxID=550540 RepID=E1SQD0_FERBD|nr:hypothetical protein [Ferrimonas balearica]ADN77901.1 conserved hypothetical protein [Ferrimonas balearica DSM 9799]